MSYRTLYFGIAAGAIFAASVWIPTSSTVVAQDAKPASGEQRVVAASVPSTPTPQRREGEPIVIPAGRLGMINVEDVPSQRDGVVMFLGTELTDGEQIPTYEAIGVQIAEIVKEGETTKLVEKMKRFRRLKEGDAIQADQLLGVVDDTLARADVGIKQAKLDSAKAESTAAIKTRDEASQRWETAKKLYYNTSGGGRPAISLEDLRGAELTYYRYLEEAVSKAAAIKVAEQELNQANKTLSMYELKPKISGIVKSINKHRGEAVKSLEPVLQIQNYDRLRVDALLQEQYANRLDKGMQVFVEPVFRESPRRTLVGHRGLVTGVAVSKDPQKPLVVSCSDDHTVQAWELSPGDGQVQEHVLKRLNDASFLAVACTPRTASANLCLAGDEQGDAYLWDLNDLSAAPRKLNGHHRKPVHCVAFSPDGKTCATAGSDQQILVFDTGTGNLRCTIPGHRNPITALYFVPGDRLISVSKDPNVSIRVWELDGDRYREAKNGIIQRRDFSVANLGVSPDGKHVMDELPAEMRVVSVPDAEKPVPRTEAILRPREREKFMNFALFSPDGQSALTTQGREGILQLWRINFNQGRSYELRQFVSPLNATPTSAAFSPDGAFVVAAVNDRIFLWPMPGKDEGAPLPATIINVEKPIDATKNQVRITAELDNPGQRLRPGDEVTMVAYPQKK